VCCGGYGKHLTACEQKLAQGRERAPKDERPQGKVDVVLGSEPLLPHSVAVQHNWTDAELYPILCSRLNLLSPSQLNKGRSVRKGQRRQSLSRKRMTSIPPRMMSEKCLFGAL
jgi:hypothetical protein